MSDDPMAFMDQIEDANLAATLFSLGADRTVQAALILTDGELSPQAIEGLTLIGKLANTLMDQVCQDEDTLLEEAAQIRLGMVAEIAPMLAKFGIDLRATLMVWDIKLAEFEERHGRTVSQILDDDNE